MRRLTLAILTGAVLLLAGTWVGSAHPTGARGLSVAPDHAQQANCDPQSVVPIGQDFFTDISAPSGIQDENFVPEPPDVPSNDHSRLGFVDINGDGNDDIVAHNMADPGNADPARRKPFEHLVFLSQGDGTFANFSTESGLRNSQAAFLAFGDVDNDGDQDAFGGIDSEAAQDLGLNNHLFLNDGQGHFSLKANSGVEGPAGRQNVTGNAVFADFNGDTKLDLFLGNGATSARYINQLPDQLYFGNGDGTFTEVTAHLQPVRYRLSNGSVACDYDNDGDLDIFVSVYGVSQDLGANVLWENDGQGVFTDTAVERGFASLPTGNYFLRETGYGTAHEPGKGPGQYVGSNGFGLQCEDANNDGYMDIYIATISHAVASDYSRMWSDPTQLLINQGPAEGYRFKNVYLEAELPFNEGDLDGAIVDFDNDGLMDLSVSRESKYEGNFLMPDQKAWFGLMHQLPSGKFESVGLTSGINDTAAGPVTLPRMKAGHNNVWSDIDHDGDLDLLVGGLDKAGTGRPNFLFRNDIGSRNAWLDIRLTGDGVHINRDAIGARAELIYPDRPLKREVKSSRGMFNSMDTRVLHFGLGNLGCAPTIKVTWPDGEIATFDGTTIGQNRAIAIQYGEGEIIEPTPTMTWTPAPTATNTPVPFPTDPPTVTPGPRTFIFLPVTDREAVRP